MKARLMGAASDDHRRAVAYSWVGEAWEAPSADEREFRVPTALLFLTLEEAKAELALKEEL